MVFVTQSHLAALFLAVVGGAVLPLAALGRPAPDQPVAVVFAPGVSLDDALGRVMAAGGLPLRAGRFGNVLVARSDRDDFADNLQKQGAWLLLDPILAGCGDGRPSAGSSKGAP